MTLAAIRAGLDPVATGEDLHALVARLYPICRSITGPGVRETLRILGERLPLEVHEVPTGTQVLDWTVPREWAIRDAYVADGAGRRLIDFRASNLHVLNYSVPVRARMTLDELRPHLFTLPDQPTRIPYRTSYYNENWGFCLAHEALDRFAEDETYEVVIDATLADGSLSYGECAIEGSEPGSEVLVSAHVCHPSLCNDNLSGIAVAARLAELLAGSEHRHTYRFVFVPGTIGSIAWLARNRDAAARVVAGLVLTGVGDPGPPSYKRSRRGDALIDRAMAHVIGADGPVRDFSPWGYDERQYGSPGFDLPVGVLARTQHGTYPEYHTSGDDLGFVRPESLADSLDRALAAFDILERDGRFENVSPFGEPQLGRRGLYGAIGGASDKRSQELAMLWVLNQSDGTRSLLDISARAGIPFATVADVATLLVEHRLLVPVSATHLRHHALPS
jgi:aminopeptidase-like protein